MKPLTREQLIQLVEKIRGCSACEQDLDALLRQLEANEAGPQAAKLIFAPADGKERTAAEIVELALGAAQG